MKRRSGAASNINDLDLKASGPWSTGPEKIGVGERYQAALCRVAGLQLFAKTLRLLAFSGVQKPRRTLPERKLVAGVGFEPTTFRL